MAEAPLRFGVIGTGAAGRARIAAIAARKDAALVATAGPGPSCGVIHFEDGRALLERRDIDAVIYAGPLRQVTSIVTEALGRRLNVLCARAPGRSNQDVLTLRGAEAGARDRVLQFSFPLHYHGSVATAKSLAAGGAFGELLNMRGVYATVDEPSLARRGGALFDKGLHMLDLMLHFSGPFEDRKSVV